MKKLMITMMAAALLFGAADTFAQGFGVKGSFNLFNLAVKVNDNKVDTKMFPTFDAGVFYEIPVAPEFLYALSFPSHVKGPTMNSTPWG